MLVPLGVVRHAQVGERAAARTRRERHGEPTLRYFFVWPRAKMLATKFKMSVALDSLYP